MKIYPKKVAVTVRLWKSRFSSTSYGLFGVDAKILRVARHPLPSMNPQLMSKLRFFGIERTQSLTYPIPLFDERRATRLENSPPAQIEEPINAK
jgi:hypothetical protein